MHHYITTLTGASVLLTSQVVPPPCYCYGIHNSQAFGVEVACNGSTFVTNFVRIGAVIGVKKRGKIQPARWSHKFTFPVSLRRKRKLRRSLVISQHERAGRKVSTLGSRRFVKSGLHTTEKFRNGCRTSFTTIFPPKRLSRRPKQLEKGLKEKRERKSLFLCIIYSLMS